MENCVGWKGNTLSVFSRRVGLQASSRKEHSGFLCLRILVVDIWQLNVICFSKYEHDCWTFLWWLRPDKNAAFWSPLSYVGAQHEKKNVFQCFQCFPHFRHLPFTIMTGKRPHLSNSMAQVCNANFFKGCCVQEHAELTPTWWHRTAAEA